MPTTARYRRLWLIGLFVGLVALVGGLVALDAHHSRRPPSIDDLRWTFAANREVFACLESRAPPPTVVELSIEESARLRLECGANRFAERVGASEGRLFVIAFSWGHGAFGGFQTGFTRFPGAPPKWDARRSRLVALEDGWFIYQLST